MVDHENHEEIDVQGQDGYQREVDLAHSHHRMLAVDEEIKTCCVEDDGIDDSESDVGDGVDIIVPRTPVVTSRIEIDHLGMSGGGFDGFPVYRGERGNREEQAWVTEVKRRSSTD